MHAPRGSALTIRADHPPKKQGRDSPPERRYSLWHVYRFGFIWRDLALIFSQVRWIRLTFRLLAWSVFGCSHDGHFEQPSWEHTCNTSTSMSITLSSQSLKTTVMWNFLYHRYKTGGVNDWQMVQWIFAVSPNHTIKCNYRLVTYEKPARQRTCRTGEP